MKHLLGNRVVVVALAALMLMGTSTAALAEEPGVPAAPHAKRPSGLSSAEAVTSAGDGPFFDPVTGRLLASWEAGDLGNPNNPYLAGTPRGTPDLEGRGDRGAASTLDSMVEASRAQQSIRMPFTRLYARATVQHRDKEPGEIINDYGWGGWGVEAAVVSPPGAPHRYGHFPPAAVRSVVFGSVPVTYTINISQLRDQDDLPIPLAAIGYNGQGPDGASKVSDGGVATGQVSVRISDLVVDGVPVELGEHCVTSKPVDLELRGEGFWSDDPAVAGEMLPGFGTAPNGDLPFPDSVLTPWATTKYYDSISGGLLEGRVSVPPFSGCGTGGEDLSTLVSSVASSPDNDIKARQSTGYGLCLGWGPGQPISQASFDSGWWLFPFGVTSDGPYRCPDSVPFPYPVVGGD